MSTRDILDIAKALTTKDWKRWVLRTEAVKALRCRNLAVHPLILPILLGKLRDKDDEPEVLIDIYRALVPHAGYPEVFSALQGALSNPMREVRIIAVQAMSAARALNNPNFTLGLLRMADKEPEECVLDAIVQALIPEAPHSHVVLQWLIARATQGTFVARQSAIHGLLYLLPQQKGLADVLEGMLKKKSIGDKELVKYIRAEVAKYKQGTPC